MLNITHGGVEVQKLREILAKSVVWVQIYFKKHFHSFHESKMHFYLSPSRVCETHVSGNFLGWSDYLEVTVTLCNNSTMPFPIAVEIAKSRAD